MMYRHNLEVIGRVGDVSLSPNGPQHGNHLPCCHEDTRLGERVQTRACRVNVSGRQRVRPCLVLLPRVGNPSTATRSLRSALQLLRNYPRCVVDKEYKLLLLFWGVEHRVLSGTPSLPRLVAQHRSAVEECEGRK